MAIGEAAPLGPAADRARSECLKLFRAPEVRAAVTDNPDLLERVRALMQSPGMAA